MKFKINSISGVFFQKIKDGQDFNKYGITVELVGGRLQSKRQEKIVTKYFYTKEVAQLFCKSLNLHDYADERLLNE